jgi:hypothetical protein
LITESLGAVTVHAKRQEGPEVNAVREGLMDENGFKIAFIRMAKGG